MSGPGIHPDRAAMLYSIEQPITTSAAHSKALPPDVRAARKARVNNDLVNLFNRPCSANNRASVQGIGLYTHVAIPQAQTSSFLHQKHSQKTPILVFLPIGGQMEESRGRSAFRGRTSPEVKKVFKEVQQAVNDEERHLKQGDMDINQLRKRYNALDVPNVNTLQQQDLNTAGVGDGTDDIAQQGLGRRPSLGTGLSHDIAMGGVDLGRRPSAGVIRPGNTYEPERDPRLRG